MFYAKVGEQSVVYTGDYNTTPDRHLGSAWIDKLRPDLFITETTYATMIRDSKRCREHDFLRRVTKTVVENGGKVRLRNGTRSIGSSLTLRVGPQVLIPVFALGRAQELCILLDSHWERMNINVPIYFAAGLTEKANYYYKLFVNWTNQKIKETFVQRYALAAGLHRVSLASIAHSHSMHSNMFDFKHIKSFEKSMADHPGPMVLFATPGMLHAGLSLEVFKKWAGSERNMVVIPGYCVVGTVGNKLLAGKAKSTVRARARSCWFLLRDGGVVLTLAVSVVGAQKIDIDKKTSLEVKCKVKHLSFSAHADAKGIMQMIRQVEPRNVMLVHGERSKMYVRSERVIQTSTPTDTEEHRSVHRFIYAGNTSSNASCASSKSLASIHRTAPWSRSRRRTTYRFTFRERCSSVPGTRCKRSICFLSLALVGRCIHPALHRTASH